LALENEYTGELLEGIYKNSVINGLGLIITSVIQTTELYRSNKTDFRLKVFIGFQTFTTVVFTVWLLYVWIKGSNFGSHKACNYLAKYVLLFIKNRETVTWLRVVFILYLVIMACALLFDSGVSLRSYKAATRGYLRETTGHHGLSRFSSFPTPIYHAIRRAVRT